MFLSIGMLKQKYFLADIFILSAEKQPIKLSWRKIECLLVMAIPLGLVVVEVQVWKNIKGFSDMKYTNRESDLLSVLHIFYPKK